MSTTINNLLIRACFEHPYDSNSCFICADELSDNNRTEEHVIPKWVQEKYNLWNQELTLSNFTTIPYRQLKIPCCLRCNNRLSLIEKQIREAIELGVDAVESLPQYNLFQWLAKIYLGMMYKELFLNLDRQDPQKGPIVERNEIQNFSILHLWLQTFSKNDQSSFMPGSIFIFSTQLQSNPKLDFL